MLSQLLVQALGFGFRPALRCGTNCTCLQLSKELIESSAVKDLPKPARQFVLSPLLHSEDLSDLVSGARFSRSFGVAGAEGRGRYSLPAKIFGKDIWIVMIFASFLRQ